MTTLAAALQQRDAVALEIFFRRLWPFFSEYFLQHRTGPERAETLTLQTLEHAASRLAAAPVPLDPLTTALEEAERTLQEEAASSNIGPSNPAECRAWTQTALLCETIRRREAILEILEVLSPERMETLLPRFWEGRTAAQIATTTGQSERETRWQLGESVRQLLKQVHPLRQKFGDEFD